jgi:ribosome biogenesis GTPase / thiamine phosphate phosphatase
LSARSTTRPEEAAVRGQVIAAFGRQYLVETEHGAFLRCVTRGKQGGLVCGDLVVAIPTGPGEGVVDAVEARRSLFQRAATHRAKPIAANATQVAIVVAGEPSFSEELVYRAIAAAEHERMKALVVINKADLAGPTRDAADRLAPLAGIGYRVVAVSAMSNVAPLAAELAGETTVLVGQSGMGKSTIVNALVPGANAETREISKFLDSGRHTTTHARLYHLDAATAIVDCPGLQDFGLAHLSRADIEQGFPELRPCLGTCRFSDCSHRSEPGCAVLAAAQAGRIHPRRMELLLRILAAERPAP